jgi:hypothetical protein
MSRAAHNPHAIKPVDLEDIWGDLSKGIKRIYSQQSMPKKRYMELYTYPPMPCHNNQYFNWKMAGVSVYFMCARIKW